MAGKTWVERKMEYLKQKGKENWDVDDYEAWCYCEEVIAEYQRDAEYLGCFTEVY